MINWFNMKKKTLPCQVLENKEDIEKLKGYVKEAYKTTEELTNQTTSVPVSTTNIGEATSGWLISPNGLLFKIVGVVEGVANILFYADILGPTGPANTLSIGYVTSGEQASANIMGDAPNQTLNLTLPKGEKGDGFNFMGSWVSGNEYYKDDVVTYQLGENQVASYVLIAESLIGSTTPPNQDSINWKIIVSGPKSNNELILDVNLPIFNTNLSLTARDVTGNAIFKNLPFVASESYNASSQTAFKKLFDYLKSNLILDGRVYGGLTVAGFGTTLPVIIYGSKRGYSSSDIYEIIIKSQIYTEAEANDWILQLRNSRATLYSAGNIAPGSASSVLTLKTISGALAEKVEEKEISINLPIIDSVTLSSSTGEFSKSFILSFSGGESTINITNYPILFAFLTDINNKLKDGTLEYNKEYFSIIQTAQYFTRGARFWITKTTIGGTVEYLNIEMPDYKLQENKTVLEFYISGGINKVVQDGTFENYGGFKILTNDSFSSFDGTYPKMITITK